MANSNSKAVQSLLFVITGSRGAGKTTFCDRMVRAARESGWQVAGLISRPEFETEAKGSATSRSAIQLEDLRSGTVRRLAMRSDSPTPGSKHWKFDDTVMDWGSRVLEASTPCDLLVIDEVGPLELEREAGWQTAFTALKSGQYAIALVVVRPELLGEAMLRWPDANLVEIDTPEDSAYKAGMMAKQLF